VEELRSIGFKLGHAKTVERFFQQQQPSRPVDTQRKMQSWVGGGDGGGGHHAATSAGRAGADQLDMELDLEPPPNYVSPRGSVDFGVAAEDGPATASQIQFNPQP
jgi:hypothetical protein